MRNSIEIVRTILELERTGNFLASATLFNSSLAAKPELNFWLGALPAANSNAELGMTHFLSAVACYNLLSQHGDFNLPKNDATAPDVAIRIMGKACFGNAARFFYESGDKERSNQMRESSKDYFPPIAPSQR